MNDLISLQSLFSDKLFRIPIYQRGYAWTLPQLKDFWEDVSNLPLNVYDDKYHYTGMLSIKRVPKDVWDVWNNEKWAIENSAIKPYYVVDGQQRLTTFIIAIYEICKLVSNLEENIGKDKRDVFFVEGQSLYDIEKLFISMKKSLDSPITTYKFGYEKDNPSFDYFINKTLEANNLSEVVETFYTLNLENAKSFFRDNIKELYEEKGLKGVSNLYIKLTQKLVFNANEIQDGFNEYVAFETINNRGKKLSNLELLKNRLIYLVSLYPIDECPLDDKNELFKNINEAWKEIYKYLGKNKLSPLNDDDFLMNHWILYFKYNRKKGEAYRDYLLNEKFIVQNIYDKVTIKTNGLENYVEIKYEESDIDEEPEGSDESDEISVSKLSPKDISDYVNSIMKSASIWYKINNPEAIENSEEKKWLEKLNRLGFSYFKPLITASYLNENISSEDRVELFKKIESYIFITFKTSGALSNYGNNEIYQLTNQIYRGFTNLDVVYNALDNRISGWLIDGDGYYKINSFKTILDRLFEKKEGFYSWSGLKYFLYEYELYLMENRQLFPKIEWKLFVRNENSDKVSIEHILPQSPDKEYWKIRFGEYDEVQLKKFTNTLGNLLALSQSINSSLQNDSFEDKKNIKSVNGNKIREGYSNGSFQEIEVSRYNEWTPKEIKERGLSLLTFMEKRWGIKFKSDSAKIKLLCLEFMSDDLLEDEYNDEGEYVHAEAKIININMIKTAYEYFKRIYKQEITLTEAVKEINEISGMNENSARMYYNAYKNMIEGTRYTKQINATGLEYFLEKIKEDNGEDVLNNALNSVKLWKEYAEPFNISLVKENEILSKYNVL